MKVRPCLQFGLQEDVWLDQTLQSLEQHHMPISRDTIYRLLKACSEKKDIATVRRIQSLMVGGGLDCIAVLGDHLIRVFASCGSLLEANHAFHKVKEPSEYTWSSIISANAKLGQGQKALSMYQRMQQSNVKSNKCIYIAALKACSITSSHTQGMLIHDQILESGVESDVVIGSTLIDMYGKCGGIKEAQKVFDKLTNPNLVSWNALIAGYALQGHCFPALELFERMQQEGIEPDKATLSSISKACGRIGALKHGQVIHNQILRKNLESDVVVGSSLINMYAKCWSLEEARKVFDKLSNRDVVSWRTMIAGYAMHEHAVPALELFEEVQQEGTFSSILKACGSIGAIDQGRMIHNQVIRNAIELDVVVGSALVDMYAKCGSIDEAGKVFDDLPRRNVISWGAMIAGYARCGNCMLAQLCLDKMQHEGFKPNDLIFCSILAACGNVGLVDQGCEFFKSMRVDHNIIPSPEHYVCMVDLLGRAGHLKEAEDLLQKTLSNVYGWMSLLSACKLHGKVEIGRRCFEQIVHLDPNLPAAYELMSHIYVKACMWKDADRVQGMRQHINVWKKPGRAWIELNNEVHEFIVGENYHLQDGEIFTKRKNLRRQMEEEGYKPQLELMLHPWLDNKGRCNVGTRYAVDVKSRLMQGPIEPCKTC